MAITKLQNEIKMKNKRKFFMIRNLDSHLNIELFGKIKLQIKTKNQFN